MQPFLALIQPLTSDPGAHPEHPIAPGGEPPTIWPSPGYPAHPIAPGGPPPHVAHPIVPGIWPDPGPPEAPPPDEVQPPPADTGGWAWCAEYSAWGFFPGSGSARPKS